MIDSFEMMRAPIEADRTRAELGLRRGEYAVVTLHRPSNVDRREDLEPLVQQLLRVAEKLPLVFPLHPRTRGKLEEFALLDSLNRVDAGAGRHPIQLVEPLGYVQFMNLVIGARAVITDSGGVQEETTYLGIPCLTLRANTERPITVSQGSNRLVKPEDLISRVDDVLADNWSVGQPPDLWDGRTAQRCVDVLKKRAGV